MVSGLETGLPGCMTEPGAMGSTGPAMKDDRDICVAETPGTGIRVRGVENPLTWLGEGDSRSALGPLGGMAEGVKIQPLRS